MLEKFDQKDQRGSFTNPKKKISYKEEPDYLSKNNDKIADINNPNKLNSIVNCNIGIHNNFYSNNTSPVVHLNVEPNNYDFSNLNKNYNILKFESLNNNISLEVIYLSDYSTTIISLFLYLIVVLYIAITNIYLLSDVDIYLSNIYSPANMEPYNFKRSMYKTPIIIVIICLMSTIIFVYVYQITRNFYFKITDFSKLKEKLNLICYICYFITYSLAIVMFVADMQTISNFPIKIYQMKLMKEEMGFITFTALFLIIFSKYFVSKLIYNAFDSKIIFLLFGFDTIFLVLFLIYSLALDNCIYREVIITYLILIIMYINFYSKMRIIDLKLDEKNVSFFYVNYLNNLKKYNYVKKIKKTRCEGKDAHKLNLQQSEEKQVLLKKESTENDKIEIRLNKDDKYSKEKINKKPITPLKGIIKNTKKSFNSLEQSVKNKDSSCSDLTNSMAVCNLIRKSDNTFSKNKETEKSAIDSELNCLDSISNKSRDQYIKKAQFFSFKELNKPNSRFSSTLDVKEKIFTPMYNRMSKNSNKLSLKTPEIKFYTNNTYNQSLTDKLDSEALNQLEIARVIINSSFQIETYNKYFEMVFSQLIVNETKFLKKVSPNTKKKTSPIIKLQPMFNSGSDLNDTNTIEAADSDDEKDHKNSKSKKSRSKTYSSNNSAKSSFSSHIKPDVKNKFIKLEKTFDSLDSSIFDESSGSNALRKGNTFYTRSIKVANSNSLKNNNTITLEGGEGKLSNLDISLNKTIKTLKTLKSIKSKSNQSKFASKKIKQAVSIKLEANFASDDESPEILVVDSKNSNEINNNNEIFDSKKNISNKKFFRAEEILRLKNSNHPSPKSKSNVINNLYMQNFSHFNSSNINKKDDISETLMYCLLKEFHSKTTKQNYNLINNLVRKANINNSSKLGSITDDEKCEEYQYTKLGNFEYNGKTIVIFIKKIDVRGVSTITGAFSPRNIKDPINAVNNYEGNESNRVSSQFKSAKSLTTTTNIHNFVNGFLYEIIIKSTVTESSLHCIEEFAIKEKLSRINNLMLSKISHEIKTPIIGIQNLCDLIYNFRGNTQVIHPNNLNKTNSNFNIMNQDEFNSISLINVNNQNNNNALMRKNTSEINIEKIRYLCEIVLIMINDVSLYLNSELGKSKEKDMLDYKRHEKGKAAVSSSTKDKIFNFESDSRSLALGSSQSIKLNPGSNIDLVELNNYIESLSKGLLIIYSKENCSIVTKFDTSLQHHKICIDEIKLKQLLFNLISNAIKNTDSGTIKICFIKAKHETQEFKNERAKNKAASYEFKNVLEEKLRDNEDKDKDKDIGSFKFNLSKAFSKSLGKSVKDPNSTKTILKYSTKFQLDNSVTNKLEKTDVENRQVERFRKRRISITKINSLKFHPNSIHSHYYHQNQQNDKTLGGISDYSFVVVSESSKKKIMTINTNVNEFENTLNRVNSNNKELKTLNVSHDTDNKVVVLNKVNSFLSPKSIKFGSIDKKETKDEAIENVKFQSDNQMLKNREFLSTALKAKNNSNNVNVRTNTLLTAANKSPQQKLSPSIMKKSNLKSTSLEKPKNSLVISQASPVKEACNNTILNFKTNLEYINNQSDYYNDSSDDSDFSDCTHADNKYSNLIIKIEDCGPGLDSLLLTKIKDKNSLLNFDDMLVEKNDKYEDKKGFGIGLVIIKRLVSDLDIKLEAQNKFKRRFTDISIRKDFKDNNNIKDRDKKLIETDNVINAGAIFTLSFNHALIKDYNPDLNKSNVNFATNMNQSNNNNKINDLNNDEDVDNSIATVENKEANKYVLANEEKNILMDNLKHSAYTDKIKLNNRLILKQASFDNKNKYFMYNIPEITEYNPLNISEADKIEFNTHSPDYNAQFRNNIKAISTSSLNKFINPIPNNLLSNTNDLNSRNMNYDILMSLNNPNNSQYSFANQMQSNLGLHEINFPSMNNNNESLFLKDSQFIGSPEFFRQNNSETINISTTDDKNRLIFNTNPLESNFISKDARSIFPKNQILDSLRQPRFSVNIPNSDQKEYNYFPRNVEDYFKLDSGHSKSIKLGRYSHGATSFGSLVNNTLNKKMSSTNLENKPKQFKSPILKLFPLNSSANQEFDKKACSPNIVHLCYNNNEASPEITPFSLSKTQKFLYNNQGINTALFYPNQNNSSLNLANVNSSKENYLRQINSEIHSNSNTSYINLDGVKLRHNQTKSSTSIPGFIDINKLNSSPNLSLPGYISNMINQIESMISNSMNTSDDEEYNKLKQTSITCFKSDFILQSLIYPRTKKIIIIDDNIPILHSEAKLCENFLVKRKLESKYKVITYHDGIEALYAVYRDVTIGDNSIKLIISDEMMNYMNGSEMHSLISKKFYSNKKVPMVICSAFSNEGHFQKMKELGLETFKKPLNKGNVEYLFEKYCGIKTNNVNVKEGEVKKC